MEPTTPTSTTKPNREELGLSWLDTLDKDHASATNKGLQSPKRSKKKVKALLAAMMLTPRVGPDMEWGKLMIEFVEARNIKSSDYAPYLTFAYCGKVYKMKSQKKASNPVWNQTHILDIVSQRQEISFLVASRERVGEDHLFGKGTLVLDTSQTTQDDVWLPILKKEEPTKGEVHVRYQFFSLEPFLRSLREPRMELLRALTRTTLTPEVASAIMNQTLRWDRHQEIVSYIIQQEVDETKTANQLFRFDSQASKLLVALLRITGANWINKILGDFVAEVCSSDSLEVDPNKLGPEENLKENAQRLEKLSKKILDALLTSTPIPADLHQVAHEIHETVSKKFPEDSLKAVGAITFLRYVCPLITMPPESVIHPDKLQPQARRSLLLITKIVTGVINQLMFSVKENFMVDFNPLLSEYIPKFKEYLTKLATKRPYVAPPVPRHNYREQIAMIDLLVVHTHQNYPVITQFFNGDVDSLNIDLVKVKATLDNLTCNLQL